MKFKSTLLSFTLVSLVFSSVASAKDVKEPNIRDAMEVANKYFVSMENGNLDEAVAVSTDKKYANKKVQKKEYEEAYKYAPLKDYKIISVDDSDLSHVKLNVALTYDEFGELPPQPFSVDLVNGKYTLTLEPVLVHLDPSSEEFGSVTTENFIIGVEDNNPQLNSIT
ncbi:hypothetical protein SK3146_03893 [Paenibacillus konkukensis]|uniref:NEAT domain-containing protein n=2 Tax=Paenibacillus konkukensis TaxID=2020716 RepID=A0ABY4RR57_9BACL|nr:hypothetical protein SK3146_03893 [Paenibacillus konkukensis]